MVYGGARTKSGEVEESAVGSVSDVNASPAREILLIMAARYREKIVGANTQPCLRPPVTGNGSERTPRCFIWPSILSIRTAKACESGQGCWTLDFVEGLHVGLFH